MELSRWKKRRFTPTWGDNHEEAEPAVIVFSPPSVGWMSKWRELALHAPTVDLEAEVTPETVKSVSAWGEQIAGFRSDILGELVLAVESLTLDGKAISREEAIEFILENEGLRDEVFTAILAEGTVSIAEKKA
jgi:hypothetical protein